MSEYLIHISGPTRMTGIATIGGDRQALEALRAALDDALASGSGGMSAFSTDGEVCLVAVVLATDMSGVCTAYQDEVAPRRSGRELYTVEDLPQYQTALSRASGNGPIASYHIQPLPARLTTPEIAHPGTVASDDRRSVGFRIGQSRTNGSGR